MLTEMTDYTHIFKDKRITQMGLGLLGRGVGDARYLARSGAELLVTDLKDESALQDSLKKLESYENISYRLGAHDKSDFEATDLILKSPSVPLDTPYIKHAREHGVPIDMSASLFARITGIPMVGITGTRGKSTVHHTIAHILTHAHQPHITGGNVHGVSNLALLSEVSGDMLGIFELDSWQLQGFGEMQSLKHAQVRQGPLSPQLAVFTTFMPDHMNYYNGDMDAYLSDKANIFLHQDSADTLIVGTQALPSLERYKRDIHAHVLVAGEHDVPSSWNVPLPGIHNRYNVGIAVAVARQLGVAEAVIQKAVETLTPVSGRLEYVGKTHATIPIYNDNSASTPEATQTALNALDPEHKKNILLIAGGAGKALQVTSLVQGISEHARHTVLLPGTGTDELLRELTESHEVSEAKTISEAFDVLQQYVTADSIILFSPGFASFGQFTNVYDREKALKKVIAHYVK
jgi:UDP-N-acetylmuramoylalanine--D-glutamate ligase